MAFNYQRRLRHCGDRMSVLNAEMVIYVRNGVEITINASPILGEAMEVDPNGAVTRVEVQDWGIQCADINFGDGIQEPLPDDYIERQDGRRYRPKRLGPNDPHFRYVTSEKRRVILHTQRVR